jgi:cation diffusion facilitator CzcD-associated flavoprotein CzcO
MSSYASKNIRPQYRQVVIVGAGVSGIAMACMLRKRLGVEDFVILDKEPAPAGSEWSGGRSAGQAPYLVSLRRGAGSLADALLPPLQPGA